MSPLYNMFHVENTMSEVYFYAYNKKKIFVYTRAYWDRNLFLINKLMKPAADFNSSHAVGDIVATVNKTSISLTSRSY